MKRIITVLIFLSLLTWNSYAQQVSSDMRTLLSSEGKILYGEEPNSFVVMDFPENIERVSEFLKMVDVLPQQVLIEARVVEVKLQGENSLGVNWELFAEKGSTKVGQFRVSAISQAIPYNKINYPPGGSTAIDPFTISIFDENISSVLSILADTYNTDILSAPRVTTVNNRTAEIRVIQSLPWAEPSITTSDTGGSSTVTWTIHFESVGITLQVTPTINDSGDIAMILNPEISEKTSDYELTVSGGGLSLPYNVPVIDRRTASTKVIVGNGQTLIIGGLIKNKMVKGETKIPWLGDLPMLGHLFKTEKETKDKTELLIFVSPTIIDSKEVAHMARQERFGSGAKFVQDKERQERMMLVLENNELKDKVKLSSEWDALVKQQNALTEQTNRLEQAVLSEESNLKKLEQAKNEIIDKKKTKTNK